MDDAQMPPRRGDVLPGELVAIPIGQLAAIYEALCRCTRLGQTDVREWLSTSPEVRDLRLAVFSAADLPAVFAGQWLPRERRQAVRDKLDAEARNHEPSA